MAAPRRRNGEDLIRLGIVALCLVCSIAFAQQYPAKQVRVVVPYPPGSTPDLAATPRGIIGRLSTETVTALQTQETREALGKQGFDVVASSPEEFSRWIRLESDKWSKVIRTSGATAD